MLKLPESRGAKWYFCPPTLKSRGAKIPLAPVESAPMVFARPRAAQWEELLIDLFWFSWWLSVRWIWDVKYDPQCALKQQSLWVLRRPRRRDEESSSSALKLLVRITDCQSQTSLVAVLRNSWFSGWLTVLVPTVTDIDNLSSCLCGSHMSWRIDGRPDPFPGWMVYKTHKPGLFC